MLKTFNFLIGKRIIEIVAENEDEGRKLAELTAKQMEDESNEQKK